ncbi:hypothetical protein FGO68_gene14181 [Halteria grandinella]|uniref:Uncharacterized protein n=1 Tax=Halteria grandinella TaxID=5974 RepID=A0A8J8NN94_HALGN|nr:hypothetical protein FGO68_gene14181 [Halteria grandinella]
MTSSQDSWRCSVFVTFIVSYALLALFGVLLFIHHRWQQNLEKRLLIEDYQQKAQRRSGSQRSGSSRQKSNDQHESKQALLNNTEEATNEQLGVFMKSIGRQASEATAKPKGSENHINRSLASQDMFTRSSQPETQQLRSTE